ncbi:MAG: hypothetical protein HY426_04945 [Candidatus Levybacteria bacterium]|nr:hypothetical protein [Candidatus Levybacteria bacterium]
MKQKIILIASLIIFISIPITVLLAGRVQNFINQAAGPDGKLVVGVSMPGGVSGNEGEGLAAVDAYASATGQYPATFSIWINFGYGSQSFPSSSYLDGLYARGITPVIFWQSVGPDIHLASGGNPAAPPAGAKKYSNQSIANGSFDSYLNAWGAAAKAYGKNVIVRFDQEMNGSWFPWSEWQANTQQARGYYNVGNTPANFVSMWKRVHDIVRNNQGAKNVKFLWAPIGGSPDEWYPGNNFVQYVGFDQYTRAEGGYKSMVESYSYPMQRIRKIVTGNANTVSSKPVFVAETGVDERFSADQRAAWFANGLPAVMSTYPEIHAISYFNFSQWYIWGGGNPFHSTWNNMVAQAPYQGRIAPAQYVAPPPPPASDSNPIGYHDTISCEAATGWTCDPDNYGQSLTAVLYADGAQVNAASANVSRPDVPAAGFCGGNPNVGFSVGIPASLKDGNNHNYTMYAVNIGANGSNYVPLGNTPKSIACSPPPTPTPIPPTPTPTPTPSPTPTPTPKLTATPTPRPTATPTPTSKPTSTPTPTPKPVPIATPTPTPKPGSTILHFAGIKLHGIGTGGDNTNPNLGGNKNPKTPTRNLTVELYDSSGKLVSSSQGNVIYSSATGDFSGDVVLSTSVNSGDYLVKIKSQKHLKKQLDGAIAVNKGSITQIQGARLITGDANGDGLLSILDYNVIIDCYSDLTPARNCSNQEKKTNADLSDDGLVNQNDYSLFLRELSVKTGD